MSKGDQTRHRIIEQSAPLFNKYGLAGVSIRRIMQAANLQKGGIYRHFDSKADIAIAAFDYTFQKTKQQIEQKLAGAHTPTQKLLTFVENFIQVSVKQDGGCVVMNTAIEHDDGHPILRERAHSALRAWENLLIKILRDGIANGEFKADIVPKEVAAFIIATLEGHIMLTRLRGTLSNDNYVQHHLLTYIRCHVFSESNSA